MRGIPFHSMMPSSEAWCVLPRIHFLKLSEKGHKEHSEGESGWGVGMAKWTKTPSLATRRATLQPSPRPFGQYLQEAR